VRIQADHVLRGYEAVSTRLMTTVTASVAREALHEGLAARLARDAEDLPLAARILERRFPGEPYRQRFGYIAERLRQTRARLVDGDEDVRGGYATPEDVLEELDELRDALSADRLDRVAHGELQDLRWQVETFGFHAFGLEVRQHADVHPATLAAVRDGRAGSAADEPELSIEVSAGVTAGEVLDTFKAMSEIQAVYGAEACHRYVVSFTRSARDVTDVLELASTVGGLEGLDVVPLFESADALTGCARIVDDLLTDPAYREHLRRRGDHQEVMLGYSDSTKESGSLAAGWMLYRAQEQLAEAARRHHVRLTLFHGRGGAIGRGGGPMNRAILASAPGSIQARLKLTEQGEVIADRYANAEICLRHLEQLTNAVLIASTAQHDERAREAGVRGAPTIDELAETARRAYRELVWEDPAFEAYFRAATPIDELAGLAIGSRPAARAASGTGRPAKSPSSLHSLRAIPWVFAWSQSRANLPGWYGIGAALTQYERDQGEEGLDRLRHLYAEWPFFASILDNAEMSLAKSDLQVAQRYATLAPPGGARRIWRRIRTEALRTEAAILRVTGRERLLDSMPVLQRSIALRNPYVDSLSELQVRLLARLRALPADDAHREPLLRLVHLTVNGVAAGVQNTG
jgi:phosphoenolpyruvate carboxylase